MPSGLDFQIWDNSTLDRPDRGPQSVSCSAGPEKAEFSGLKIEALDTLGVTAVSGTLKIVTAISSAPQGI